MSKLTFSSALSVLAVVLGVYNVYHSAPPEANQVDFSPASDEFSQPSDEAFNLSQEVAELKQGLETLRNQLAQGTHNQARGRSLEQRLAALEQAQPPSYYDATDSSNNVVTNEVIPPLAQYPVYVSFDSSDPAVTVEQNERGELIIHNSDPELVGKTVKVTGKTEDGTTTDLTFIVPDIES